MGRRKLEVIKDFGEFILPEKWEDLTLKKFQDIMRLYESNDNKPDIVDLIQVISEKPKELIQQLPMDFINKIMARLLFLNDPIEKKEPSCKIVIGNDIYYIRYMEQLKFMEYVDVNTLLDHDKLNYAGILATLCRKKDEVYDDKFISEVFAERMRMFEELPVTEIMPVIGFFLMLSQQLDTHLQSCLMEGKSQINLLLKDIENSLQNMGYKKYFMTLPMIRLKKLKKLVKNI